MRTVSTRIAPIAVALLMGCAASTAQAPQSEYPPPPPPPSAAPPGAEAQPAPPSAATTTPGPTDSAGEAGSAGPLPALPSSAPTGEATSQPGSPPAAPPTADAAPPSSSEWVYSYPNGQWVYTSTYGWIWVPSGSTATASEGNPYVYLYTPSYGWTWYISPWGWGPYHYGGWVRHPWAPRAWRGGWVAHPRVIVHLGGGRHRRWR